MNDRLKAEPVPDLKRRVAARIRELRRVQHLSQAELARRVGIRPGPMNVIEQAQHLPSGRLLCRLADVLAVSTDVLLDRVPGMIASQAPASYGYTLASADGPRAVPVVFSDDPKLKPDACDKVNAIVHAFLALEDLCGVPKRAHIPLYLPFAANETGLEGLVAQVRQALGIGQGVIFDYLELLENAGLRIVFCPLPSKVESVAFYDDANANALIFIRARLNVERQLFELIKRLGTIYLHTRRQYGGVTAPRAGREVLDDVHAARKFAALFLMPAAAVCASVDQLGIAPGEWTYELLLRIKHRFGVSAHSFLLRLEELHLIAPPLKADFQRRIEAYYRKTGYGEPDASRRILTPNGRLGDLWQVARQRRPRPPELKQIARALSTAGVGLGR